MTRLKEGTRIRMKVRCVSGWKGEGTVVYQHGELVIFQRDHHQHDRCSAMRHEVTKIRMKGGDTSGN